MCLINCCWLKYPGQKRVTSVGILPWIFSGIKSKYLRGYQFGEIMLIHIVSKWLKLKSSSKITGPGTSVAVQWLKLCTLNAVSMSSTPSQGTKILHALQHVLKKKKKNPQVPLKVHMSFPGGSDIKEYTCKAGDPGSILGQEDPLEKSMTTYSSLLAVGRR